MSQEPTIFVVDDEPDVRAALGMLIKSVGLKPEIYESPRPIWMLMTQADPAAWYWTCACPA